jgi:hypothetical protein
MRTRTPAMPRRPLTVLLLAVLLVAGGSLAAVRATTAAFSAATANDGNSLVTQKIFSGTRTSSAWSINDLASGSAVDRSDVIGFADGRGAAIGTFPTAFDANRWAQADLASPLAAGTTVTGAQLRLRFAAPALGVTVCLYVEIYRVSAPTTPVGTHGSASTPLACNGTLDYANGDVAEALPEVTSTDVANDLRVRVIVRNSAGTSGIALDRITVTGTTPYQSFELFRTEFVDRSSGTSSTVYPWRLARADGAMLVTSEWPSSFTSGRYLELRFPANLPTGAVVTAGELQHAFITNTSPGPTGTTCVYYEVWALGALVSTHNAGNPTCTSSTSTPALDTVTLPALTDAQANDLRIRVIGQNSRSKEASLELATVALTWSLP